MAYYIHIPFLLLPVISNQNGHNNNPISSTAVIGANAFSEIGAAS